jgi:hypothetical protein
LLPARAPIFLKMKKSAIHTRNVSVRAWRFHKKVGYFYFFWNKWVSEKEKMGKDAAIPLDTSISLG